MTREYASLLVAVGQEQVFAVKSPFEESSVDVFVHHLEESRLARPEQRGFGCGHQPVFRVVVNEDLDPVADPVFERNVTVGKQHFVPLLVREEKAVVGNAADGEGLRVSGSEHVWFF